MIDDIPDTYKSPFLNKVAGVIRRRNYTLSTERTYIGWIRRYIRFHGMRHPKDMGEDEVSAWLTHLAVKQYVTAPTQNQALNALVFMYRHVLETPLKEIGKTKRARPSRKIPEVLTEKETALVLSQLEGTPLLICELLYGCGLRVMECMRLRVKDIDFGMNQVRIHDGKGNKDRVLMLPEVLCDKLQKHLERIRGLYDMDRENDVPGVYMPFALERKYPEASKEWRWHFVFAARGLSYDPRSKIKRRHHAHPCSVQREVRMAGRRAKILKHVTPHIFRHSFATHLLQAGYDLYTIKKLMGHKHIHTTEIYLHVINKAGMGVISPIDKLRKDQAA